ncbi:hypothetical protein [Thermoleptolyngbya sp.]
MRQESCRAVGHEDHLRAEPKAGLQVDFCARAEQVIQGGAIARLHLLQMRVAQVQKRRNLAAGLWLGPQRRIKSQQVSGTSPI